MSLVGLTFANTYILHVVPEILKRGWQLAAEGKNAEPFGNDFKLDP